MMADPRRQSTATLLAAALADLGGLLRSEIDLARAEARGAVRRAALGLCLMLAGVAFGFAALGALAAAIAAGLSAYGLHPGWAWATVAFAYTVAAALLGRRGWLAVAASSAGPARTVDNIRKDTEAVKEVF